ncbi:hypothetical protein NE172_08960 [Clostridium botulinum]|uniref:Uncharacterized protein n=1 Tax=Clostridium botulinum TaxID=1491 RepID=A0A6B4JMN2_CLOBO|nr:hypothetical protein [Clostridium botulinum]EES50839.1 hypothetical protein CLO_2818 [Clostridium botulinum E1 str. 'BoNT E Beluga']MBY6761474.1 hypothetical protein [Clostridium botulinum]MBY6920194.1 hypothetical protein [Clostridium botulinum]MCR1131085.1 hypothetical protein [Clostridium botulinum]NFJ58097.1 hypothetical protein [Clostridium botulinum]
MEKGISTIQENSLSKEVVTSLPMLNDIRPAWKSKRLIERVEMILKSDPSSACQRILNAAIFDLREKIVIAGVDIAEQVAKDNRLPPINSDEDVLSNYSTSKIIDLAYKMGLLTRPEWRKISRAYEIRRDLEHEDDEYEADLADCMYIFKPCIDAILSKDPIRPLRVTEIKDIVEKPELARIDISVIQDYERAPDKRQDEIYKFLISNALNSNNPEITRNNCVNALSSIKEKTSNRVLLDNSNNIMKKLGRGTPPFDEFKVYNSAGVLPYFRKDTLIQFYTKFSERLNKISHSWRASEKHENILCELKEIEGLKYCPKECIIQILTWLILCYIGENGGYGQYGSSRQVFYSDIGAPLVFDIIKNSKEYLNVDVIHSTRKSSSDIELKCRMSKHVERRYQDIIDLFIE